MRDRELDAAVAGLSGSVSQLSENLKATQTRIENYESGDTRLFRLTLVAFGSFLTMLASIVGLAAYFQIANTDKINTATNGLDTRFTELQKTLKENISESQKDNRNEIERFVSGGTVSVKDIRSYGPDPNALAVELTYMALPASGDRIAKQYRLMINTHYEVVVGGAGSAKLLGSRSTWDGPILEALKKADQGNDLGFFDRLRLGTSLSLDAYVTETLPGSVNNTVTFTRDTCNEIAAFDKEIRSLPHLGNITILVSLDRSITPMQPKQMRLELDKRYPPINCRLLTKET